MKTFCVCTMAVVFLFLCSDVTQAQTTQTKLDQAELMKQYLGTWKCEVSKDTTFIFEAKSYGTGLDCLVRAETKGKIIMEGKAIIGYDKKTDKYIEADLFKGSDIILQAIWFISKNTSIEMPYENISKPENGTKSKGEFKSPDLFISTDLVNNKPVKTNTWTRVKH
jgi:hypothetical protein